MKVLVTGANGFIGSEIVLELTKRKIEVVKLVRNIKNNLPNSFEADITVSESLNEIGEIQHIDAVIHSAGLAHQFGEIKKSKFDAVNVEGTKNIAWLTKKLKAKHLILISSTAVYGIPKRNSEESNVIADGFDETSLCEPQTLYAKSKLEAENEAIEICEANNIALTILRLSPVIGESSVGNVDRLIRSIDRGRFLWIGKGENLKSFIYKKDVTRACFCILKEKNVKTEIFNLANEPIPLQLLVDQIAAELNRKIPKVYIPIALIEGLFELNRKSFGFNKVEKLSEMVEKWLSVDIYSANKIKSVYGFEPKYSVIEAIKRQIGEIKLSKQ